MRDTVRKCDSCIYNSCDYRGYFCGCKQNSEYGLYSVYGWCEHYKRNNAVKEKTENINNHGIQIRDIKLRFSAPISYKDMEASLRTALNNIGVVDYSWDIN